MGQSLSKLYVHIVFRVKTTFHQIKKNDRDELYAYIGSIIKENDSIPIIINGVGDHVHILCVMSKNIALAKLVEKIKANSSRWIKYKNIYYQKFAWQGGYSGFSVSPSVHDRTKNVHWKSRGTSQENDIPRRSEVFLKRIWNRL